MRVLVVEDEAALRSYLVPLIERDGLQAQAVGSGKEALAAIDAARPDLVLLDVGLPDISGMAVCLEIRRRPDYLPVIMLTGLDGPDEELAGFEVKADDYITKPVRPEVLLARIRAVLRLAATRDNGRHVQLGDVSVDLATRQARRGTRLIPLKPKDFELLEFLLEHPGQVFGKTQLLAQVWGPQFDGGPHAVESCMYRLRLLLEPDPGRPAYLHNRRGVGYFLTQEPAS